MIARLMTWLVRRARRRPADFLIGGSDDPYLRRWWMIPRNPLFNVYVHEICRPDDDRALHDHPWFWLSYIVDGAYFEVTEETPLEGGDIREGYRFLHHEGQWRVRSPWFRHRLIPYQWRRGFTSTWTVFVTGPKMRGWGFWCPQGFVPWRKFVSPSDKGAIGKGCDQ